MKIIRDGIHLSPRLYSALELLAYCGSSFECVADIGCDHGKLAVEILRSGTAKRVIASDVSAASLAKAELLAKEHTLDSKLQCIVSDGFSAYSNYAIQAAVICGMGGELIAKILESGHDTAAGLDRIVMQPMRGESELREYLYTHNYRIIVERIVIDAGRYYQLLCAEPGEPAPLPYGWPDNYYQFGAGAFETNDPLLEPMLHRYLGIIERKLNDIKGELPQSLLIEASSVKKILELICERGNQKL